MKLGKDAHLQKNVVVDTSSALPPSELYRIFVFGLILFFLDEIMRRLGRRWVSLEIIFVVSSTLYHIYDLQFAPRGPIHHLTFGDLFIRWGWNWLALVGLIVTATVVPNFGGLTTFFVAACVMIGFYAIFRIVLYLLVAVIMVLVWIVIGILALIPLGSKK